MPSPRRGTIAPVNMTTPGNSISSYSSRRGSNVLNIPNQELERIFQTRQVIDENGQSHPLNSNISKTHAQALYRTVLRYKPDYVLEVGMAYGVSSLAILTALQVINKGGKLISIDPFQDSFYHNGGLVNVQRAALGDYHLFIGEADYLALPQLVKDGRMISFAYIDGMHTFDYTLLDFFFIDKLLKVDGIIGFNDCALPSVIRVIRFLKTHRKYREINVGLLPSFLSRNPITMAKRIITLRSKSDRYFQKSQSWEPEWDYYKRF
jgi:predicted O-methyltransferase YrrM